jgi:Recombination endonuclease VII
MKEFCKRGHEMAVTRRRRPSGTYCGECDREHDARRKLDPGHNEVRRKRRTANIEHYRTYARKWRAANREHFNARTRKYNAAHRESVHAYRIKRMYGITKIQYEAMLKAQRGVCAICKGINKNRNHLYVDHDHIDNRVRGLLCKDCNHALGLLQDSPERARLFIAYMERHGQLRLIKAS